MADCQIVHWESDTFIFVRNVRDGLTDSLLSAATVTAELLDSAGLAVTGFANPVTCAAIAGTNGAYVGVFPDAANVDVGDRVTVKIIVDNGNDRKRTKTIEAKVDGRQAGPSSVDGAWYKFRCTRAVCNYVTSYIIPEAA